VMMCFFVLVRVCKTRHSDDGHVCIVLVHART